MPQLGDKKHQYTYVACPGCGYTRWVQMKATRANNGLCRVCFGITRRGIPKPTIRGDKNPAWKGGKTLLKSGYIRVNLYAEDSLAQMARHDTYGHFYILEHRLVMARHLGRCLEPWEIVHHKNGTKSDNGLENLELLPSRVEHSPSILLQQEVYKLRERIRQLERRITLLEAEKVLERKA